MKTGKYFRIFLLVISLLLLHLFILSPAHATNDYALKTGKGCIFCHQESTGGNLKTAGLAYIRNGYQYPISERILSKAEALQTSFHTSFRFIIGYLHLLAAVVFFGAIFYIHILAPATWILRPCEPRGRLSGRTFRAGWSDQIFTKSWPSGRTCRPTQRNGWEIRISFIPTTIPVHEG